MLDYECYACNKKKKTETKKKDNLFSVGTTLLKSHWSKVILWSLYDQACSSVISLLAVKSTTIKATDTAINDGGNIDTNNNKKKNNDKTRYAQSNENRTWECNR